MPERIETAHIKGVETDALEINDAYPGTYGFAVRLDRDPGAEWAVEFTTAYETAPYPGKPPAHAVGDKIMVYYLSRYAGDLPNFLRFLRRTVDEANRSAEQRNSVLPDEEGQKRDFLARLREASRVWG